jgi:nucleoside-diphosphate-sugar epimerase
VLDAAHCYVLALERGKGIYHAIAEEGVTFKDIATVMGKRLGLPVVSLSGAAAAAHYKWMAGFAVADKPASSAHTRRELTWQPTHATLLEDLETGHYFDQAVGVKH